MRSRKWSRIKRARDCRGNVLGVSKQHDKSHRRGADQSRNAHAPHRKRSARHARWAAQSAAAVIAGSALARTAFGLRAPALPGVAEARRFAGSRPAAHAVSRRPVPAWLGPTGSPATAPAERWALIAALTVMFAVRRARHRAKTFTRIRCHTASVSIPTASGTWTRVHRFNRLCMAYCTSS